MGCINGFYVKKEEFWYQPDVSMTIFDDFMAFFKLSTSLFLFPITRHYPIQYDELFVWIIYPKLSNEKICFGNGRIHDTTSRRPGGIALYFDKEKLSSFGEIFH